MALKLTNTERIKKQPHYALYCINIFGNGLKTIKDEFKLQVSKGLRQTVFVLDLEDIQAELNNPHPHSKLKKDFKENSYMNLINLVLNRIQVLIQDFEMLAKTINEEIKFDLYEYWIRQNGVKKNIHPEKTNKSVKETKGKKRNEQQANDEVVCSSTLVIKEHNRIGQSQHLSKRQYIKDEPILGKLYIIILGQMSKSFYMDLLRKNQPLQGIINFMPTEGNYDILLGNNKLRNFIMATLESINSSVYNLRQEIILKPVGLFNYKLPVISNCLAKKISREIFDQLTWCIFDIDILKQQYEQFYFKPFQVTDVEIPASENVTQLYHKAYSLSVKGQFQKSSLPTTEADLASIASYLNSLLSTCEVCKEAKTESHQTNLIPPNSFSTITNINKFYRLVVAGTNNLLLDMLKCTDLEDFNAVYLCCLDYNVYGKFSISQQQPHHIETSKSDFKHLSQLPKYLKYYFNHECSAQRITELKKEYDEHEIHNISDGYKLHIFKRTYHIVKESENSVIIPTRLCFRDFTLFQMEDFLKALKPPKANCFTDIEHTSKTIDIDDNIFIRPHSLKAHLLQKELSKNTLKPTNESHSPLPKDAPISEEYRGLSTEHPLLQGYNLDDTLQEMNFKNSTYNFRNGCIKLYEENWCFKEMNKQLSLNINEINLFFSKARYQLEGISNNVRIVTKDNISLRILNASNECSKIVMMYPNGLSIYHHDKYCEQFWFCDKTAKDEQKRIYTTFGVIIVFFKSQNIEILRYNGEIYRLFQQDLLQEAEEQCDATNLAEVDLEESRPHKQNKLFKQIHNSKHSKKNKSEESIKMTSSSKSFPCDFIALFNFELKFFNSLCSSFGLTYVRLSITTSEGKVINITQQGEFSEGLHCSKKEWFDFFANEAYCERSDGVKMIWSQDSFKCFHNDGTVFTTTVEEDLAATDADEFESQITESSSHNEFLYRTEDKKSFTLRDEQSKQSLFGQLSFNSNLLNAINNEDYNHFDIHFTQYKCQNMFMQHPNYAEVFIRQLDVKLPNLEIFGLNNIRIFTSTKREESNKNGIEILEELKIESKDFVKDKSNTNLIVNVWFGKNLQIKVDTESFEIFATMTKERETESDSLCLSLKYTDNIIDAFKCWVKAIDSLKGTNEHKLEELYFMEKLNNDSSRRGFEFFASLPVTSDYKYEMSNNIIELIGIHTINKTMLYNTKTIAKDLAKFPRFKQSQSERYCQKPDNESELPSSLCANVFIEVPKQLRSLSNITKFLEPFDNIYFKSLRGKFKTVLNHFLKPKQQLYIKIACSRINWKKRLLEHKKRVFNEKHCRGLYAAMIKHETYPNYWKFTHSYGGDVRCIEYFDFVQDQCKCCNNHMI